MPGKFVVEKTSAGKVHFVLKAGNGETIISSLPYGTKPAAIKGIQEVKKAAKSAKAFERRLGKNGKPYFVVLANGKTILGQSEAYATPSSATRGINSVKRNAPAAKVHDET